MQKDKYRSWHSFYDLVCGPLTLDLCIAGLERIVSAPLRRQHWQHRPAIPDNQVAAAAGGAFLSPWYASFLRRT
jgi:tryptophan synthase beta subunit